MQARAVRTRLLRCGRSVPAIYLAQSCRYGAAGDVLLLRRGPKYTLVETPSCIIFILYLDENYSIC